MQTLKRERRFEIKDDVAPSEINTRIENGLVSIRLPKKSFYLKSKTGKIHPFPTTKRKLEVSTTH